ncbi:MAG: cupin domain-containing protein, partial [Planctomycetota bacterium]
LEPGAMSSQRHWHANEDDFVYVVRGPITLITDEGEQELTGGMVAGFPAGVPNGHRLVNRSDRAVHCLIVGTRAPEEVAEYPDIDLPAIKANGVYRFTNRAGELLSESPAPPPPDAPA